MKILIINGPNLNMLGSRQPELYGKQSMESYLSYLREQFSGHELVYKQSNHEGQLIDFLQTEGQACNGIVLNPGAYAHTSLALADAVRSIRTPVIEVHISNIHARETYRRHSYVSEAARGILSGFGLHGYALAIRALELLAGEGQNNKST